jgi:hypothetical protein
VCCGIILCSIFSNTFFLFSVVINHTGKESTDDVDVGVDEKGLYDGSGVESSGHESPDSANDPVKQSIGEFLDVCCGIILYSISSNTFFSIFNSDQSHGQKKH